DGLLLPSLHNPALADLGDAALLPLGDACLALTTDSFVVRPLIFPGGSIGELAVNGTVNDLAMSGATPLGLTAALIIEEGLNVDVLRREVETMAAAAQRAGVAIVSGDTKVVERGKGDELYIITTGLGVVDPEMVLSLTAVRPGDRILCSGTLGDHGVAILIARGNLDLEAEVRSDTRPLTALVSALKQAAGHGLRWMRDPTRGGVGTVLNELARDTGFGVTLWEETLPINATVNGACEILGIDPLYVANEGKLLAVVDPKVAEDALQAVRFVPGGEDAAIIGEVSEEPARMVLMHTEFGGTRMVDMLIGDPLPRIC
ncbi:MAG: hydrogenase expression/formation protein HypE, partial [Chloroflexota bacterium]